MAVKTIEELKQKFEKGDQPTAADFIDLIDSFLHVQLGNWPTVLPASSGKHLTGLQFDEYNIQEAEGSVLSAFALELAGDWSDRITGYRRLRVTYGGTDYYCHVNPGAVVYNAGTGRSSVVLATAAGAGPFPATIEGLAIGVITAGPYAATPGVGAVTPMLIGAAALGLFNAWAKGQQIPAAALTDAANISWDPTASNCFRVTLGGNRTLLDPPSGLVDGGVYVFYLNQDGTGGRTLAYGSLFKFQGGVVPTLSTAPNARDTLVCTYDLGFGLRSILHKGW